MMIFKILIFDQITWSALYRLFKVMFSSLEIDNKYLNRQVIKGISFRFILLKLVIFKEKWWQVFFLCKTKIAHRLLVSKSYIEQCPLVWVKVFCEFKRINKKCILKMCLPRPIKIWSKKIYNVYTNKKKHSKRSNGFITKLIAVVMQRTKTTPLQTTSNIIAAS